MVAVKILDKEKLQRQFMGEQVKNEILIMKQLKHPNVVQMKEVLANRTKLFIVVEYVRGDRLFEEIAKKGCWSASANDECASPTSNYDFPYIHL